MNPKWPPCCHSIINTAELCCHHRELPNWRLNSGFYGRNYTFFVIQLCVLADAHKKNGSVGSHFLLLLLVLLLHQELKEISQVLLFLWPNLNLLLTPFVRQRKTPAQAMCFLTLLAHSHSLLLLVRIDLPPQHTDKVIDGTEWTQTGWSTKPDGQMKTWDCEIIRRRERKKCHVTLALHTWPHWFTTGIPGQSDCGYIRPR